MVNLSYRRLAGSESGRVLTALQLNADASIGELAAQLRLPERRVRHTIEQFKRAGLLTPRPIIRLARLGILRQTVYLAIHFSSAAARREWLELALATPAVVDVFELCGRFSFGLNVYVRAPVQVSDALRPLLNLKGAVIDQRSLGTRIRYRLLRRRIFSTDPLGIDSVTEDDDAERIEVDETDLKVLKAISRHGDLSRVQQAAKARVPYTTYKNRLRSLRERGVLVREVYGVHTAQLGLLTYRILVRLRHHPVTIDQLVQKFALKMVGVYVVMEYLGEWDFEFLTEVQSPLELAPQLDALSTVLGDSLGSVQVEQLVAYRKITELPLDALR